MCREVVRIGDCDEDADLFGFRYAMNPMDVEHEIQNNLIPNGFEMGRDFVVTEQGSGIRTKNDWVERTSIKHLVRYTQDTAGARLGSALSGGFMYFQLAKPGTPYPPQSEFPKECFHPGDIWALRRVRRMLAQDEHLIPRLKELAKISPQWAGIVQQWDAIEKSYAEEIGDLWVEPAHAPKTEALLAAAINL